MKYIVLLLAIFFIYPVANGQTNLKSDVVLQRNGEELFGKVIEIDAESIRFNHNSESLTYTIRKSNISKITYASGRIEVYNKLDNVSLRDGNSKDSDPVSGMGNISGNHNKIAVLPFSFVQDGEKASDELSTIVQAAGFSYLQKHARLMSVLDIRNTNAMLIKAGVTRQNIEGYTMDDICNILGVEYLVDGRVQLDETSQSSSASNFYSSRGKREDKELRRNGYSSGVSNVRTNYATVITVDIYDDKGSNIYNRSRKSFYKSKDAYQTTLEYLLKRSPIFSR